MSAGARAAEACTNAATGSAGGVGIQYWHTAGVSGTPSKITVNCSPAAKRGARGASAGARAAEACTNAATGSAGGVGIQYWHTAGVSGPPSKITVNCSPAAKRCARDASAGDRAAETCTNAATGSAGGVDIQYWHTAGVSGTSSKITVNCSPAAEEGARGASAGERAAEACTNAATGSARGVGIQRSLRSEEHTSELQS